jgi:hypothetical protein
VTVVRPSPAPWDAFAALLSACMWLLDGGEGARVVRHMSGKAVGPLGENNSLERSLYKDSE